MNDTVEVKLPVSNSTVVIRNYTTRADDKRAEEVLYAGVKADQDMADTSKSTVSFPLANIMASQQSYIPRLVVSIDGDSSDISNKLDNLRSADYEAVEKAVGKVVEENSPKARAAKTASKSDTNKN
jgi:hypothetical protein